MEELKENNAPRDRAILVGLSSPRLDRKENADEESLEELGALVETAGGVSAGVVLQTLPSPNPHTFIGEGKVDEIRELVKSQEETMVIFDNDLSPSQMRVLSEEFGVQVLDRSGLILDIFAQRAKTREGKLQVELAQYQYYLPRLTVWNEEMGRLGGGIGTRGPGETQLETDKRYIRSRIQKLRENLEDVRKVRAEQRRRRQKNDLPVVALVGYTNAGKSTLLNQLAGLEKPTRGVVRIGGVPISQLNENQLAAFRQKHIGFVFQSYNLLPELTAAENVAMPLMFKGIDPDVRLLEAKKMLCRVGLKDRMDHFPNQMSGGQQQRVGIARAFVTHPEVVFADEPTGNLDTRTTKEVMHMIRGFAKRFHQTIVLVSHDPEMTEYADRIVTLIDGRIVSNVENQVKAEIDAAPYIE